MKKMLALLLALVLVFGLVACGGGSSTTETATGLIDPATIPEEARYGGVLDMSSGSSADNFDPMYTTGWTSYLWSFPVYENPIAQDDKGNFVPNACDLELSEDMLTLKLFPREGVTFHDGSPVEAEDIMATVARSCALVPNVKKWFAGYFAADPYIEDGKVVYTFTEFKVNTLMYFAGWQNWVGLMPKEVCEKYGENPINDPADCIGTGPYKLVNYQTNALYALERYEGYVPSGVESTNYAGSKKAYLDKINVWINPDPTSSTMSLLNGDYDIGDVGADYMAMAEANGLVSEYDSAQNIAGMAFNTKGDRPVNDVNLRLAIAYALDYAQMSQAASEETIDETCPMTGIYYTDVFNNAPYRGAADLEKAKEYLEKANYNGEEIILLSTGDDGKAIVWEANLKAAGINAKIEYMEWTTLKAYYADNNNPYDCVFFYYETRDNAPCMISSTPREKFWGSEKKDELFSKISSLPAGSEESLAAWAEMADLWVEECNVLNFCTVPAIITHHKDLVTNWPGLQTPWNTFWVNPEQHMN